jgi:hypothetical protein
MERCSTCRTLEECGPTLASSQAVRKRLRGALGPADAESAVRMLATGRFEDDLGGKLHDLLTDEISCGADTVWSGRMGSEDDPFGVYVRGYEGVYFVHAIEYDPVGYFLRPQDAVDYIFSTWDDARTDR